ncbi:unnamed protein product [Rhizoctonia solani]|uniref:Transmembrane protein n=1 Tax=Rhizoctonia solani TaxID=456999 RepID=A0A8H2WMB8_9AGAM|nr:unnamed protein product [Rhizoctonia solani]
MSLLCIAGAGALALSFGLLVCAMLVPSYISNLHITACIGTDVILHTVMKLVVECDLEAKIKALANVNNKAELKACVAVLVPILKASTNELLKIGANISIDADAKTSIATCIVSIITLLVKVYIVVHALLVNLNVCIGSILELIVKVCVHLTVGAFTLVKLNLIAKLLAHAGLQA